MNTLYGIKNCDTVKKARKWLESKAIDYTFHDFRTDGLNEKQLVAWIDALGWETLVNKRSTTWKQLDSDSRAAMNADTAIHAILEHPTLIKRPLLERNDKTFVGFKDTAYADIFEQ